MNDLYSYDSTAQVTGVTYGSGRVVGYQYDPLGNLTQKVDNGTAANYTANSLNQYTYINSQALSYDAKGNLLQRPGWAYTWDAHNRLRSAAPASPQSGSLRLTFSYDGRNRCAIRRTYTWTEGAWQWATTLYLTYSDWNLIEERDAEGTLAAAYVHGPEIDDVIARLTPTSTLYYHADAQHSTVAMTGAQGDVLERYTYDIFGLPTVRDGASYATLTATAVGNRLLFQGREWLAEVKLTDHRNRLYSPEMHRWLNRDPIGERGGINLYQFVGNAPNNGTDPSGYIFLNPWTCIFLVAVIVVGTIIIVNISNPTPPPDQGVLDHFYNLAKSHENAACLNICDIVFGRGGAYENAGNRLTCRGVCPVPTN